MSETAVISREVLLDTAMKLADAAAQMSSEFFRFGVEIDLKSDESPVTIADQRTELAACEVLEAQFLDHAILGEEYGSGDLTKDHVWAIDPIEGTRSFISGHPLYGFLLAHMYRGSYDLGIIAMPELGERYVGQKGQGAKLNGRPIATSKTSALSEAIIYINEGDKLADHEADVLARFLTVGHTRRFGYDCYPHALLASGHVDLVIDYEGGFNGFCAYLDGLNASMSIPKTLTGLGVKDPDLDVLVDAALRDPSTGGNPMEMTAENTRTLFEAIL